MLHRHDHQYAGGASGGLVHVGDPILASNLTRRVDFALFMVAALENDELIHGAPAIVGCRTPLALAHARRPAGLDEGDPVSDARAGNR